MPIPTAAERLAKANDAGTRPASMVVAELSAAHHHPTTRNA